MAKSTAEANAEDDDPMTVINQGAAMKRFHQGLYYLLGTRDQGRETADAESFLAVVTVMAYLGAYAFPGENLHGLKMKMTAALKPFEGSLDVEATVETGLRLAEVFRRPGLNQALQANRRFEGGHIPREAVSRTRETVQEFELVATRKVSASSEYPT